MTLILPVYALYNKSQPITYFLGLLLLGRLALGVWVVTRYRNFSADTIGFDFICLTGVQAHNEPGLATFL